MDFETILSTLHDTLREKLSTEQTNEFLVDFMKRSVATGVISTIVANSYLILYGCSIPQTCLGCIEDQLNQLGHMDVGGCLYRTESE